MLKRWAQNLALLLASVIGAFALLEIGLRVAGVSYPLLQTYDEHRGIALRPGAAGWWRREGEAFVRINRDGLRDRDHALTKSEGTFRIAVLGDSYAEARSVPVESTFWAVLERAANRCALPGGRTVEVINFGVTDYGTAQELLTLRHHALKYDPDLVLLAFFAGNDVRNNSRALEPKKYRPFYTDEDGTLQLDASFREMAPYQLLSSWQGQLLLRLSDYFRTVEFGREVLVRLYQSIDNELGEKRPGGAGGGAGGGLAEGGLDYSPIYKQPVEPVWQDAWRITERLITTVAREAQASGAAFELVTLTTGIQVHPDRALRQEWMEEWGIVDLFYADQRITELAEREGFPVLHLGPTLQAYAEERQVFLHGFDNTALGVGHWNVEGHRIAGETIARHLCARWQSDDRPQVSGRIPGSA